MICSPEPGRWFTPIAAVGGLIAALAGLGSAGILAAENPAPPANVPIASAGENSQAIAVRLAGEAVEEAGSQAGHVSVAEPASALLPLPWADDILLEPGARSAQARWSGLERRIAGSARPALGAILAEDRPSNSPLTNPAQPVTNVPASQSSPASIAAGEAVMARSSPSSGSERTAMLRVTNTLRAAETGKLALHVRILERDRARARELAADSNGKAAETGPLAASLLEVASGRTAGLLDSANSADLDRVVHFLTEQKVLSPVHDQTVTTESGRPVTLIARGVRSAPSSGLAGVMTGSAAPCPQDLVVTCLPAVADRERIRLRVVRELAVAGRGAVAASASRLGVPGAGTATVMREGQTLAIAGLEEDAAQPWLPRALPFLSQVLKGRTQTSRSKDFIVLVTPQVAPPSAETETAEAASPGIRAGR